MNKLLVGVKRLFTHPYGACSEEGCDRRRERWMDLCPMHEAEQIRKVSQAITERKFSQEADIIAEGIRRSTCTFPIRVDSMGYIYVWKEQQ